MEQINLSKVQSVYSGKAGACCCGCAGKHTYAKATQAAAGKYRGYAVGDEECNDRVVKLIVNKMNKNPDVKKEFGMAGHIFYSVEVGQRLYVAYLTNEDK
jgi:hypothetical protein